MSNYTNVILFMSGLEETNDRIDEVNNFKHNNQSIKIFDVNERHNPDVFPRYTFIGCYNYFDAKAFIEHIKSNIRWEYPEYVQVFIKEEGYSNCTIYINAGKTLLYSAERI